jgi:diketogulonate reductase-like aldo/keto reductase
MGVEAIGLYQLHRPDASGVPYEESGGAIRDLLDAEKIQMAGISNANPDQIRAAQDVLGGRLVSVQNQYSPPYRSSEAELRLCHEMGVAFLPWSPLGGISRAADLGSRSSAFQEIADAHAVSPPSGQPGVDARGRARGHPDSGTVTSGDCPRLGPVRRDLSADELERLAGCPEHAGL